MDRDLLRSFFEGECTEEEVKRVLQWAQLQEDSLDPLQATFDNLWNKNEIPYQGEIDSEQLFGQLQKKLKDDTDPYIKPASGRRNQWFSDVGKHLFLRYAAIISFAILVSLLILQYRVPVNIQEAAHMEMIEKTTTRGQKTTVFLSDGSKIILNSASSIRYPKFFSDSSREVQLHGEAYFDVAEDKRRPFSVISKGLSTTALGTSFVVSSRANSGEVFVALQSGKVVVKKYPKNSEIPSSDKTHYFLDPGESITYNTEKDSFEASNFDYNKVFQWKDDIIYFKDASFDAVVDKLELWYDVEFEIENQYKAKKDYTGEFKNESLENVLKGMSYSLDFDYFINQKNVKIIFN
ncbi:FecR domain-containing protein [Fulvivirgaceae bacterium BMA10]|uniref:FecR domain-containing protein n=1 Tax=Splendidivirga corallicola TaxID=3051826 RepID=A0ABT8KHV7_9BACT|nr:FecR domain-containing protein [Fulvivirgaceae bacterium BMA10]